MVHIWLGLGLRWFTLGFTFGSGSVLIGWLRIGVRILLMVGARLVQRYFRFVSSWVQISFRVCSSVKLGPLWRREPHNPKSESKCDWQSSPVHARMYDHTCRHTHTHAHAQVQTPYASAQVHTHKHVCQGRCYCRSLLSSSGQPLNPTSLASARLLTVLGSRPMVELEELVKLKEWTDLLHVLSREQKASYR